jgi:uncharacterized UPF0160 family protein
MNLPAITKIITHPGLFHADDVCAVAWLRFWTSPRELPVERRNPAPEELADPSVAVVDVGGQNEPSLRNFDHHQKGGAGKRWDTQIPRASFGQVFDATSPKEDNQATRFERRVIDGVDALDNGWEPTLEIWNDGQGAVGIKGWLPSQDGHKLPAGRPAQALSLSACISGFNPEPSASAAARDEAFERAVAWVRPVLENEWRAAGSFVAAEKAVKEALLAGGACQDRVLVLNKFVPWNEHVQSRPDQEQLLYVVYPSERGGFCVQQIPKEPCSFEGRKPLPAAWAGLRGKALADLVGLSAHGPATFCHPGRFIGGAETMDDALRMAAEAIKG